MAHLETINIARTGFSHVEPDRAFKQPTSSNNGKQTALGMARQLPDIRASRNYVRPRDSNAKQLDVTAQPLPSSLTEADLIMRRAIFQHMQKPPPLDDDTRPHSMARQLPDTCSSRKDCDHAVQTPSSLTITALPLPSSLTEADHFMPLATFQSFKTPPLLDDSTCPLSMARLLPDICSSRNECDHSVQTASSLTFTTQHMPSAKQVDRSQGVQALQLQRGSHVAFVRQVQPDAVALPQFSNGIGVQVANGMVAEDHQSLRVTAVDTHLKLSTPQNQGSRMSSLIGLSNNQLLQTTGKRTARLETIEHCEEKQTRMSSLTKLLPINACPSRIPLCVSKHTNKPPRNVTYMSGPVKITNMKRVMYTQLVRHCHDVLTRT